MPSYRRLQIFAIAISVISVVYNGAEGGVSIGFGAESSSRSLIAFGIQSAIEVLSALLVLWRFRRVAKPGDERGLTLGAEELRFERVGTLGIGSLLIALALATEASSISTLILRQEPDASNASLIIAASALVLMVLIWLPKRYLAKALDSSVMQGSLIYKVWKRGWWVDSATSMVLGLLFVWEGVKMVRWARSSEFGGGCCPTDRVSRIETGDAELGHVYRDICECCREKVECRNSDECKCLGTASVGEVQRGCCIPVRPSGDKCCTREIISTGRALPGSPPNSDTAQEARGDTAVAVSLATPESVTATAPRSHCCGDC